MPTQQRKSERRPLQVRFTGRDSQGLGQLFFTSADLSVGGTFLVADLLLEQGETLTLEVQLPGARRPLTSQARVAWVRRFPDGGSPAGMGVEFLAMSDDDRRALASHLAQG
jgi:uncharacterized protein (TIGR02266 family)